MSAPAKIAAVPAPKADTSPRVNRLTKVSSGKVERAVRVLVFGMEGVGKSTFAAGAPAPILLGADAGTDHLDVRRYEPESWTDALGFLTDLASHEHEYKTLVVDPVTWFEPLCHAHLCHERKWRDIEAPGFGKGYTAAVDEWRVFISRVDALWRKGMNVVFTAHAVKKLFKNPEGDDFDRYEIAMNEKGAAVIKQWVDAVLFARHELYAIKDDSKRVRGSSSGVRELHAEWSAAYDAKNRYALPPVLELSWDAFWAAKEAGQGRGEQAAERASEVRARIAGLLAEIGDAEYAAKVTAYTNDPSRSIATLEESANKVAAKHATVTGAKSAQKEST